MEFPDKSVSPKPRKVIKPVISGATRAERPASKRFFNFVFAESPKDLGSRIGRDVVVPRLKLALEESFNSFLSGMLWGGGSRPLGGIVTGTVLRAGTGTNYNGASASQPSALALAQLQTTTTKSNGTYQNVVCPTEQHAEIVMANLYELYNEYSVVAVADLYEMAGIKPNPADNSFGWYSIDGVKIVKTRDGFEIEMPRPGRIT